jgi:acetyltransferase-like isoleucine patch superfamily enzyme
MDRKSVVKNTDTETLFNELNKVHELFFTEFKKQFDRSLPFADEVFDRWERAKKLGFDEGTSIYDSSFVFGNVKAGKNCWIGPFTVIDGSGELSIGDGCTISTGVHIYTHDNVKKTLTGGNAPVEYAKVSIGKCTYIGPESIITKGISVGNHCVIASNSFVNKSVDDNTIVAGNPAKAIGKVIVTNDNVEFEYFKK